MVPVTGKGLTTDTNLVYHWPKHLNKADEALKVLDHLHSFLCNSPDDIKKRWEECMAKTTDAEQNQKLTQAKDYLLEHFKDVLEVAKLRAPSFISDEPPKNGARNNTWKPQNLGMQQELMMSASMEQVMRQPPRKNPTKTPADKLKAERDKHEERRVELEYEKNTTSMLNKRNTKLAGETRHRKDQIDKAKLMLPTIIEDMVMALQELGYEQQAGGGVLEGQGKPSNEKEQAEAQGVTTGTGDQLKVSLPEAQALKEELSKSQAQTKAVEERLKTAEAQVKALQAKLEMSEAEAKAVQAKLAKSQADAQALQAKLEKAEAQAQAVQKKSEAEADSLCMLPDEVPEPAKHGAGKKATPHAKVPSKIQQQTKKRAFEQLSAQEDGEEEEEQEEEEEADAQEQKKQKISSNSANSQGIMHLQENVKHFIKDFIVRSDAGNYVSSQEMILQFKRGGNAVNNEKGFFMELSKQMKKSIPSAARKKTAAFNGYCGISFKDSL